MYNNYHNDEFTQFYNELEAQEQLKTPINNRSNSFKSAPNSSTAKFSLSDLEKTMITMSPRMEILLKKEKKILEEESNYTFKPTVNKSSNNSSNKSKPMNDNPNLIKNDNNSRFDQLYSDALKRHLEQQWKENTVDKDLTFKPKINRSRANSTNNSRSASPLPNKKSNMEQSLIKSSSIDRLQQPHHHSTGKIKSTSNNIEQYLTFKPEITKRAQSIDRKVSANRLFHTNHGEIEKYKTEQRLQLAKEKEVENCTFKPKINHDKQINNNNNNTHNQLNINQRMEKFQAIRDRKIQEAKYIKESEEQMENTFKPTFKSKPSKQPVAPFHERLSQSIVEKHVSELTKQEAFVELTFKPKLIAKRAISPNGRASEYNTVYDRLYHEGEDRKKEADEERKQLLLEQQSLLTFTPEICKKSKETVELLRTEAGISKEPFHERLATGTSKQYMQDVLMKVKTELELRECTFHPKLYTDNFKYQTDHIKEESVHERLNNDFDTRAIEKAKLEEKKMEMELSGSTFAPQLPTKSLKIVRSMSMCMESDDGSMSVMSRNSDTFNRLYTTNTIARAGSPLDAHDNSDHQHSINLNIRGSISQHSSFYNMKYDNLVRENSISPTSRRMSAIEINNVVDRLHNLTTKSKESSNVDHNSNNNNNNNGTYGDSVNEHINSNGRRDSSSISPLSGRRLSTLEITNVVDRLYGLNTKSKSSEAMETRHVVEIQNILRSSSSNSILHSDKVSKDSISQPSPPPPPSAVMIGRRNTLNQSVATSTNHSSQSATEGLFGKVEFHDLPPSIKQSDEIYLITNKNGIATNEENNNNSMNSLSSIVLPVPSAVAVVEVKEVISSLQIATSQENINDIQIVPSKPTSFLQQQQVNVSSNDFASKIEASMRMIKLKPSEIVAIQNNKNQEK